MVGFIFIIIVLLTFLIMEGITWLTHRFIMHGFLWYLHEDHHQPKYANVFERNDAFFIFYADNLTNINLKKMLEFHKKHNREFTLAMFRVLNPQECGIIGIDEYSLVVSYTEKPQKPAANLAFAGIMLSSSKLYSSVSTSRA
jgi:NDP-sugar pyrophosphorylase family protein